MFNFSSSAIKALDSLLERLESETIEPIEKSIKDAKKNFKAGNYLAISSLLLLTGLARPISIIYGSIFHSSFNLFFYGVTMYLDICIDILENIKMNDFSNDYENLKNQLNDDKGKLIGYLFAGLIIGRLYEKFNSTKKKIFKKFK